MAMEHIPDSQSSIGSLEKTIVRQQNSFRSSKLALKEPSWWRGCGGVVNSHIFWNFSQQCPALLLPGATISWWNAGMMTSLLLSDLSSHLKKKTTIFLNYCWGCHLFVFVSYSIYWYTDAVLTSNFFFFFNSKSLFKLLSSHYITPALPFWICLSVLFWLCPPCFSPAALFFPLLGVSGEFTWS